MLECENFGYPILGSDLYCKSSNFHTKFQTDPSGAFRGVIPQSVKILTVERFDQNENLIHEIEIESCNARSGSRNETQCSLRAMQKYQSGIPRQIAVCVPGHSDINRVAS